MEVCSGLVVDVAPAYMNRKHLYLDLQPYTCFYTSCSFSSLPFADRQLWSNHLELDHHFGPTWESVTCPLCLAATESGKSHTLIHFARHMEDIALAALPREVESDAESDGDVNGGSARDLKSEPNVSERSLQSDDESVDGDFHAESVSEVAEEFDSDHQSSGSESDAEIKGAGSYWSVEEKRSFRDYIRSYGTNWTTIAQMMGTKTSDMIRAQYFRDVENGDTELEQMAEHASIYNANSAYAVDSEVFRHPLPHPPGDISHQQHRMRKDDDPGSFASQQNFVNYNKSSTLFTGSYVVEQHTGEKISQPPIPESDVPGAWLLSESSHKVEESNRLASQAKPLREDGCVRLVHKYGCSHENIEWASCAASRATKCQCHGLVKTIKHDESCDPCNNYWPPPPTARNNEHAHSESRAGRLPTTHDIDTLDEPNPTGMEIPMNDPNQDSATQKQQNGLQRRSNGQRSTGQSSQEHLQPFKLRGQTPRVQQDSQDINSHDNTSLSARERRKLQHQEELFKMMESETDKTESETSSTTGNDQQEAVDPGHAHNVSSVRERADPNTSKGSRKLSRHASDHLRGWLEANRAYPYLEPHPNIATTSRLAQECGITEKQVMTWMAEARAKAVRSRSDQVLPTKSAAEDDLNKRSSASRISKSHGTIDPSFYQLHRAANPPIGRGAIEDEESSIIKCICGFGDDDGSTVLCESCDTWQHILCYHDRSELVPDVHKCGDCDPRPLDSKGATDKQLRQREARDRHWGGRPVSFDPRGQRAPAGARPRVTAALWEDESTMVFQVESNQVCVARREDNNMINVTKLLNVAGMSRGRRDGILKAEKTRHVVKIGPMHLKGVWLPFERALEFANQERISDMLYPLFVHDIGVLITNCSDLTHTASYRQQTPATTSESLPIAEGTVSSLPVSLKPFAFESERLMGQQTLHQRSITNDRTGLTKFMPTASRNSGSNISTNTCSGRKQ